MTLETDGDAEMSVLVLPRDDAEGITEERCELSRLLSLVAKENSLPPSFPELFS